MPMLLEDLAEETSASSRRAADRLNAEICNLRDAERQLAPGGGAAHAREALNEQRADSARQSAEFALAQVSVAEGIWRSAQHAILKEPISEVSFRLLTATQELFESNLRSLRAARAMCNAIAPLPAAPERVGELDRAVDRLEKLLADVQSAIKHRADNWQPADPDRLAMGLQLARENKTVNATEARQWFGGSPPEAKV